MSTKSVSLDGICTFYWGGKRDTTGGKGIHRPSFRPDLAQLLTKNTKQSDLSNFRNTKPEAQSEKSRFLQTLKIHKISPIFSINFSKFAKTLDFQRVLFSSLFMMDFWIDKFKGSCIFSELKPAKTNGRYGNWASKSLRSCTFVA